MLRTSTAQLMVLSLLNFCATGMWNALNAIGGLGTGDENISHVLNTTIYATSVLGGFFAGSLVNLLGMKKASIIGSLGVSMPLLCVWLVHYKHVFGGYWTVGVFAAIGGIVDGGLMTAIGCGFVNYPTEAERSRYLAIGSTFLNLGGLLGSIFAACMNWNATDSAGMSASSHLALVLVLCGCIPISLLVERGEKVVRSDGTHPSITSIHFRDELQGIVVGVKKQLVWLLVPLFMCSIWHEVIVFNYFNLQLFNLRSRPLNGLLYYVGRILSGFAFNWVCELDKDAKARMGKAVMFTSALLVTGFISSGFVIVNAFGIKGAAPVDIADWRGVPALISFFIFGCLETTASSFSYWIIGLLNLEDTFLSNRLVGWYRTFASVGAAASWAIDSTGKVSYAAQYGLAIALWVVALACLLRVKQKYLDERSGTGDEEDVEALKPVNNRSDNSPTLSSTTPSICGASVLRERSYADNQISPLSI